MIDRIDGTDYPNIVIFEATVIPDVDKPERYFTGHAEEEIGSSQINTTSALENCETSAIGRALALMGIGVDESFASGDEVANAVFQQNQVITKDHAEKVVVSQNAPETAEDGSVCPKCGGGVTDNRHIDGGAKLSSKGEKLIREGKPLTTGCKLPLYKCADENCKGVIWENDMPKDDGESKRQEDKEPVVEEELLF